MRFKDKEKIRQMTQVVLEDYYRKFPDKFICPGNIEIEVSRRLGLSPYSIPVHYIKESLEDLVNDGIATKMKVHRTYRGKDKEFVFFRYVLLNFLKDLEKFSIE